MTGSERTIEDGKSSPAFVGRRLQDLYFTATTQMEFDLRQANEEAGLILLNHGVHFDALVKQSKGRRALVGRLRFGSVIHESAEAVLKPSPVKLMITGKRSTFAFLYSQDDGSYTEIENVDSKFLNSETAGGFEGVYVGLYATGNGKRCSTSADYDWFEYVKNEAPKQENGPR